jgi:hypothetical protein
LAVITALVRIFSYLYHLLLALFLLGVSVVSLLSGGGDLRMPVLPWSGTTLTWALFAGSLAGLASLALAIAGKARVLYVLYALAVFGLMVRGYLLSGFTFASKDDFQFALYLIGGALLAVLGAWSQSRRKLRRR